MAILKPEVGTVMYLKKGGLQGVIVRQDKNAKAREVYFKLSDDSMRLREGQLVQFVVKPGSKDNAPEAAEIEPLSR